MKDISIGALYQQIIEPSFIWACGKSQEYVPVLERFDRYPLLNLKRFNTLDKCILFVMLRPSKEDVNIKNKLIPLTKYDIDCHIIAYQYKNQQMYVRLGSFLIEDFSKTLK